MITTTMCCHWFMLAIIAVIALPTTHLASAGLVRHRASSTHRRGHRQPSPSSSSTSHASPPQSSSSSSSSAIHKLVDQLETAPENNTLPAYSTLIEGSDIQFPEGFKIVGLDADNKPFVIIPNIHHLLGNENELLNMLRTAVQDAHRNKRSASSSSSSSSTQCNFNYQVTVRRTGRCTRFGNIPACLSGDQLYPYARDC